MKKQLKSLLMMAVFGTTIGAASTAFAQAEIVPEGEIVGTTDEDVVGWNPSLAGSATLNFINNSNVIGQVEGLSILAGFGIVGGVDYVNGSHLWRNNLTIAESWARTPVVEDQWLKSNDVIDFKTGYYYFFLDWLGAYGEVGFTSSLFGSEAVTADPVTYSITGSGIAPGAPTTETTDALKVADAFSPLTLTGSVGAFAEPLQSDPISVSLRLGAGGRYSMADGVLINTDDDATKNIVEMQTLNDVSQLGVEGYMGIHGKFQEGRLTYKLGAAALVPFINNDPFERSATELLRVAVNAGARIGVFDWMSVVYSGNYIIDPQLFPKGKEVDQFQNSLLLTFTYTLIDKSKGMKALKAEAVENKKKRLAAEAEEKKAAAAKKKADEEAAKIEAKKKAEAEAEAKRLEAEQKAKDAEEAAKKAVEDAEAAKKAAEDAKNAVPEKVPAK